MRDGHPVHFMISMFDAGHPVPIAEMASKTAALQNLIHQLPLPEEMKTRFRFSHQTSDGTHWLNVSLENSPQQRLLPVQLGKNSSGSGAQELENDLHNIGVAWDKAMDMLSQMTEAQRISPARLAELFPQRHERRLVETILSDLRLRPNKKLTIQIAGRHRNLELPEMATLVTVQEPCAISAEVVMTGRGQAQLRNVRRADTEKPLPNLGRKRVLLRWPNQKQYAGLSQRLLAHAESGSVVFLQVRETRDRFSGNVTWLDIHAPPDGIDGPVSIAGVPNHCQPRSGPYDLEPQFLQIR